MSRFLRELAKADVVLDDGLGELVTITPMIVGDYKITLDPARAAFTLVALVSESEPAAEDVQRARFEHEQFEIDIRWSLLPAGMVVKKGDQVTLMDEARAHVPPLQVDRVPRLDAGRLVLVCGTKAKPVT